MIGKRWLVAIIFACALAAGCESSQRAAMESSDPAARVRGIIRATERSDQRAVSLIVDRLEDEDEAVRLVAITSLKKLTGEDRGYRPFDSLYRRDQAVQRWRAWLAGGTMRSVTTRPLATAATRAAVREDVGSVD